jgi:hypothetical protein
MKHEAGRGVRVMGRSNRDIGTRNRMASRADFCPFLFLPFTKPLITRKRGVDKSFFSVFFGMACKHWQEGPTDAPPAAFCSDGLMGLAWGRMGLTWAAWGRIGMGINPHPRATAGPLALAPLATATATASCQLPATATPQTLRSATATAPYTATATRHWLGLSVSH